MFRVLASDSAASALLLGLLALAAAGLGVLARAQRTESGVVRTFLGALEASPAALESAAGTRERRALEPRRATSVERSVGGAVEPTPRPAQRLEGARSEREFLAAFLALEREAQGTLAAQAEERLAGSGSRAEKVGFLRAIARLDQAQGVRWLEQAVRTLPAASDSEGASVAAYALDVLARRAPREEAPRRALARLALHGHDLAPVLGRSAAAEYARSAPDGELELLRPALARSNDELFVAGVLAVLEARTTLGPNERSAARLLAEFGERALGPPSGE